MSSDSENDMECTPPFILQAANEAANNLLPTKSSKIYEHAYDKFISWCDDQKVKNYSENVLLAYFSEQKNKMKWKSSTMWSQYSMIKSLLNIKKGVDTNKYMKLRAFLKKQNEGYTPKKSRVFTKEQFDKFLNEASDEQYLGIKIILLFGVSGACRCDELVKMRMDNIEDFGSLLFIKIPDSKTNKSRSFTIVGENFLNIYRKYLSLRPNNMKDNRFFIKYVNGKCYGQVMGIHKIGNASRDVASYLKLPNSHEYTGHCLRRTSATFLIDGGADITSLKQHGGWKSTSVAEGYIEESLTKKKDVARRILNPEPITSNPVQLIINQESVTEKKDVAQRILKPETITSNSVELIDNEELALPELIPLNPIPSIIGCNAKKTCITAATSSASSSAFNFQNATITNCTFNISYVDKNI